MKYLGLGSSGLVGQALAQYPKNKHKKWALIG